MSPDPAVSQPLHGLVEAFANTAQAVVESREAFTRRAAGRRAVNDTAYGVVGDAAIARRVLEALVVTH